MSPPAPVQAVLLDALGTLVGIEPPWQPLIDLLAERHRVVVGHQDVVRALRAEMGHYRAHCQDAADAASLARLRAECAEVIASELGGPVAALERGELTRTLLDALRFAAYPEADEVLRRLRAGGTRLVVVSNWDISLHEALDQAGLLGLVDGVVCSAAIGAPKPASAIFRAALELAGVPADRALHVGDSYREDVAGARAAGIAPVLLVRPPAGPGGLLAPGAGAPGDSPGDQRGGPPRGERGGPRGGEPGREERGPVVRTISSLAELVDP